MGKTGPKVSFDELCIAISHEATPYWYRRGCRCPATRQAWNLYVKDMKARRLQAGHVPKAPTKPTKIRTPRLEIRARNAALAIGAQRRIQAMMAIGHPSAAISTATGLSAKTIHGLSGGSHVGGIWPRNAKLIDEVYRRWQYEQGPSASSARWAKRYGYLPPAAWAPDDLDNPEAGPTWPYRNQQEPPRSATA